MSKISVIIITKDEETEIRDCLESVNWADEIIVIDSGSTDKTVEISKEFTDKVFIADWPGFGPQKQRALDKANGPWVLSIDADERVSPELKEEILNAINEPSLNHTHFFIPRLTYVCEQPIRHSGWYPDYLARLFLKSQGQFSKDIVHEKILVEGSGGKLTHHFLHYSYRNLSSMISRYNLYTDIGAQKLLDRGYKKVGIGKAIGSALGAFFKLYIVKRGFLDGTMGFVIALTSAETAFYKYMKLSLLQKSKK